MISLRLQRTAVFLFLLLTACACTGCPRHDSERTPGNVRLRLSSDPTTLDPALITDVQGGSIAAKVFNGLVRFNDRLAIVPDIASSWKVSPDQRTYIFRLRPDASFSTGRPVTARDFQYSFERVLDPRSKAPLTWVFDRISGAKDMLAGKTDHVSGIEAVDDHTLVLRLDKPFGPFLSLLGMTTAYVVPREEVERLGQEFGSAPVGSGPFVVSEWRRGQTVDLTARKDYFGGIPHAEAIRYRVIPEDLTAVMEFETGRLDVLQVPASEYRHYTTDPAWKGHVVARPGLNCYYLGLNCSRPPFQDVRVRRAVNMAIDRKRILETVYENRGILARGPIPPALWKGQEDPEEEQGYPYDPREAKRLLREAGALGASISIYVSAEPEALDIVEVIQEYLRKAGIRARIVQLDWSAFKQAINRGDADAFWLSWWADYPDPENFLFPLFSSANVGPAGNRSWYRDPMYDRLIERAQGTTDERTRYRLYRQAEQRIIKNAPWVFMWHRSDIFVVQPWVRGFTIPPIYSVDKGLSVDTVK
jgi:ABC-type transport system substrate-binding protein